MNFVRIAVAYVVATVVTIGLAVLFYTQQVIAKQAEIGAVYSTSQKIDTFLDNLMGLAPSYGVVLAIGLIIGFLVAAGVKRVVKPLAPVAYPIAGAAAVYTAIYLIENTIAAGGVGALGGARDAMGIALQCFAGFVGGGVFAFMRGRNH